MAISGELISVDGWMMRKRLPSGEGHFPVILMLHGWTGDENSMWVFAQRLPKNTLLIAPRGLYPSTRGGYGWHTELSKPWPWVNDFQPAVEALQKTISPLNFPEGDFSEQHILGFSQGAALAFSFALLYPERVATIASLSGFLPDGAGAWMGNDRFIDVPIFIAHGTEDELVPVERARSSVKKLQQSGAQVTYCEDNVGHKLSLNCFHGLEAFYQRING